MDDIEKRARELLCTAMRLDPEGMTATLIMDMGMPQNGAVPTSDAIRAIVAALTPPEGYVMIRVLDARRVLKGNPSIGGYDLSLSRIAAALAARPEVSP